MKKHNLTTIILSVLVLTSLTSAFTLNLNQPNINSLSLNGGINYYGLRPLIFNLTVSGSDSLDFSSIIPDYDKTLALWYPFTNAFGEDYAHIKDYSSYKSDAITNNFYTITTQGRQGSAIDFSRYDDVNLTGHDGFGSLVQTENTPQLDNLNQFTLSAWIKTNANLGVSQYIISRWDTNMQSTQTGGFSLFLNNEGRPELNIYNKTTSFLAYSTTTITDGEWHHVVGTYDGKNMSVYLDGKLNASSTAYRGIVIPDKVPLTIGGLVNNTLGRFNGTIDDVQMYTRALTTTEIKTLYNATKDPYYESINLPTDNQVHSTKFYAQSSGGGIIAGLPEFKFQNFFKIKNPSAWYRFDREEGEGPTKYNDLIRDWSGNGNDITMTRKSTSPAWNSSGIFGGSYKFDGTNDGINLGKTMIPQKESFTMSIWFNSNNDKEGQIIMAQSTNDAGNFVLSYGGTGSKMGKVFFRFASGTNGIITSSSTYSKNTWHNAIIKRDPQKGKIYLYIDGKLEGEKDFTGNIYQRTTIIGRRAGDTNTGFRGNIDEIEIYNQSLSENEIKTLYSIEQ